MTSPNSNNEPASLKTAEYEPVADEATGVEVVPEDHRGRLILRRDLASGRSVDAEGLIRFVVSPEGLLTPDIAHKLPGRGLWVACERTSLEIAIKKNIFSRAARRQVKVAPELIPLVQDLLRRRCLDLLGLARREGQIVNGFEKVLATVKSGRCAWLIEASDSAEDGRKRLLTAMAAQVSPPKLCGCFGNAELSLALGQENAIHAAMLSGRRVQRWSMEMQRLSGFMPLTPPGWALSGAPQGGLPGRGRESEP
ncbi:RNA-binding protein [Asticcacaulis sp. EMRT-3]|nr:RNA-binding protein [Asticcacaulis sp. EMRT-3]MDI7775671.1 RNA-binding protein [Asticcacaulis sp. EMRT-3]